MGLVSSVTEGWPSRFEPTVVRLASVDTSSNPVRLPCTVEEPCLLGATQSRRELVLWGDSHGHAIVPMLDRVAKRHGLALRLYLHPACLPVVGVIRNTGPSACPSFVEDVLSHLLSEDGGRAVILLGRWSHVLEGEIGGGQSRDRFSDKSGRDLSPGEQRQLLARQLESLIDKLLAHGDSVAAVYPIPEHRDDVPLALAKRLEKGVSPASYYLPLNEHRARQAFISGVFDAYALTGRIVAIRPEEAFCPEGRCLAYADGVSLYRDSNHPSPAGRDRLEPLFDAALNDLESRVLSSQTTLE